MGPVDPRPRRTALRDQGARLRHLLHGAAAPRALRPLRARGHGRGGRDPRRLLPHGEGAVRGRPRPGPAGADPARPARSRRPPLPAAPGGRGAARSRRLAGELAAEAPATGGDRRLLRAGRPGPRRGAPRLGGGRSRACSSSASSWSARASTCSRRPGRWSTGERTAAGAPAPRLLFIGFGAFEAGTATLIAALGRGDLDAAREIAARGRGLEGDADAPLPILSGFLADPPEGYAEAAREAAGSMLIGGRLEHDEVADVMPAAHTFAMPSTWPEAFGMVPAESAACGVPPTAADHSGMREVAQLLAEAVAAGSWPPARASRSSSDAVTELADRLDGWLALEPRTAPGGRPGALASGRRALELGGRRPHRDRRLAGRIGRVAARRVVSHEPVGRLLQVP